MHNILMIVRREYLERVKKKSFWIGTAVFPVLMGGLIFVSIFAAHDHQDGMHRRPSRGRARPWRRPSR